MTALGDGDQIRTHAEDFRAEHLAETTEAADDFVGDQQDVVTVENLLDGSVVARWWHQHATGTDDGLRDHGTDGIRTLLEDQALEVPASLATNC